MKWSISLVTLCFFACYIFIGCDAQKSTPAQKSKKNQSPQKEKLLSVRDIMKKTPGRDFTQQQYEWANSQARHIIEKSDNHDEVIKAYELLLYLSHQGKYDKEYKALNIELFDKYPNNLDVLMSTFNRCTEYIKDDKLSIQCAKVLYEHKDLPKLFKTHYGIWQIKLGQSIELKAPEISGQLIDGKKFKLSDYNGKVVILHFWEMANNLWLPEGRLTQQLLKLIEMHRSFERYGLTILSINEADEEKPNASNLKQVEPDLAKWITWPQYCKGDGWEHPIRDSYSPVKFPELVIVNQQGNICHISTQEESALVLYEYLKKLQKIE